MMASPAPDASKLDSKAVATEPESKSELNGHTNEISKPLKMSELAPEPEPVVAPSAPEKKLEDSTEPSLTNGNDKPDEHKGSNGVAQGDIEMKEAAEDTRPIEDMKPVDESKPIEDAKPAEIEPKPIEEPAAEVPAEPVNEVEAEPVKEEPASERLSKPQSSDVDMPDANESAPEPESRVETQAEPAVTDKAPNSQAEAPAADTDTPAKDDTPAQHPAAEVLSTENPKVSQETEDRKMNIAETPAVAPVSKEEPAAASETLPTSEVDLGPASLSQLDIGAGGTQPEEPSTKLEAESSIEVSMTDADADSGKVAREREEDTTEEPVAKRAKTEPTEEEASAATPAGPVGDTITIASQTALDSNTLSTLPQWDDPETDAREITAFRKRTMRGVIGRIRKTKSGANFRDSVQKLWPALWDTYVVKIERPVDLSQIDKDLRDGKYTKMSEFKNDLSLIYLNTLAFNGPVHHVTTAALAAIKNTWADVREIPAEEPEKIKPQPKQKPVRESRAAATASAPPAATQAQSPLQRPVTDTSATEAKAILTEPAKNATAVADGDRPKRTVRAPKPKDIDYSTKASRKKLKPELQFCDHVLGELMHQRLSDINQWFVVPVDAEALNLPHYRTMIKKPMDLGTISKMLASGEINSLKDFDKLVNLVFSNCYKFNGPPNQGNPVSGLASQLEKEYKELMKGKDAFLSRLAKANARHSSVSNASDDEDDEEEEAAEPTAQSLKEVEMLEAKYREENDKLSALIMAGAPSPAMIGVQEATLKLVQEALIKAKQNVASQKGDKPAKKAKGGKKGGNAARRASGAAAQPKKTKKAAKRTLTAADKDQIANAINDLEGSHLDKAIDIIKRDTGQNENNDGELELDIDQLSQEALLKLWELCKKVLPGFAKDETESKPPKQSYSTAAKPKKNKPMSAQEQEARIVELQALRDNFKTGHDASDAKPSGAEQMSPQEADSSGDSDSDSEED